LKFSAIDLIFAFPFFSSLIITYRAMTKCENKRLFFGKTKVMAKALGTSKEDEYQENLSALTSHLAGNVGLLFTSRPPSSVIQHFADLTSADYARAGTAASRSFTIPAGTIYGTAGEIAEEDDTPMPHSLEPEMRKLDVPTRLVKGKVTLDQEYIVCKEGNTLDSRQTRLLKMFGVQMAEFKVRLIAYWSAATQEITMVEIEANTTE
jgi:mRNA turnover protein 4